jgi:hypothetical protein
MATSESPDQEPKPEDRYLEKMRGIIRSHTHQERINALFLRVKARLPELEELARDLEEAEEDGVYRFYHGSNKVFFLQSPVKAAFSLIKEIGGKTIRQTSSMRESSRPELPTSLAKRPMRTGKRRPNRFWKPSGTPNISSI